jgi:hypothetical protein
VKGQVVKLFITSISLDTGLFQREKREDLNLSRYSLVSRNSR